MHLAHRGHELNHLGRKGGGLVIPSLSQRWEKTRRRGGRRGDTRRAALRTARAEVTRACASISSKEATDFEEAPQTDNKAPRTVARTVADNKAPRTVAETDNKAPRTVAKTDNNAKKKSGICQAKAPEGPVARSPG